MDGLKKTAEKIVRAKEIAIASHINPDGDSIGSLLALGLGLEKLGKKVYMISHDGVPKRYRGLPGARRVRRCLERPIDLAIAVDCSNKELLGETYEDFKKAGNIIEIDHHDYRRPFGDVRLVDNKAAAVGEMIYILLKELNVATTKPMAQNMIASIIVETSSFRLPNVRPFTFEVCSKLMHIDVNFYELVDTIFWSNKKESILLSGVCLARCKFISGGRIAWSLIRKEDFDKIKGDKEDVDSVPDEMRSIKSVDIAILFREVDENLLRVSLRSKGKLNVAAIAEHYNGGGHFDVAGCNITNSQKSINEILTQTQALLRRSAK